MRSIIRWICIYALVTGMIGFVSVSIQQNYRQNANDPQIQMAEDAAAALARGGTPQSVVASTPIDVGTSLSPATIVYDVSGKPLASSAILDNGTPTPPKGVLAATLQYGQNRVTWQPRPGVRLAAVVKRYTVGTESGFVLVARSLREVEKREDQLTLFTLMTWVASLILITIIMVTCEYYGGASRPTGRVHAVVTTMKQGSQEPK